MLQIPQSEWIARAEAFLADDPDPDTRAELTELLSQANLAELRDRFGSQLEFGTAGLRGLIGAGDNRMNRRVVAQTSAGLCAYLAQTSPAATQRGLCIGFDGRHKSREFAEEARAIACGAGFVVYAFEEVCPTPLLAFAVRDRAAIGGIMITASHNPAAYNGYKVYLHDGAQLRQPHDAAIAQAIRRVGPALALPRLSRERAHAAGLLRALDGVEARYLASLASELAVMSPAPSELGALSPAASALAALSPAGARIGLSVAYTALHGVGASLARQALALAGVEHLHVVAGQAEPDATFPSVAFPNPEEPGAMDAVLELANARHCDLAIANDPDADRVAVAARAADGGMRVLSGNALGVLLADHLLSHAPQDGKNLLVSTIVTTPMVGRIARAHGARWETTLTGFKWILPRALELEAQAGLRLVLGFEEALGYCVGTRVRDKDGIASAAHVVRMAAEHAAQGRTLHDALDALYRRHGLFESRQLSINLPGRDGLARIAACMAKLRDQPPAAIADRPVSAVLDLLADDPSAALPKSDVIRIELEAAQRITVRPSGTEPKLKIYLDCVAEVADSEPLSAARARAEQCAEQLSHGIRALLGV
jgi:phosphomannomutase